MFIDSHCHLDFSEFEGKIAELLQNMNHENVSHALCISVDIPTFPKVLALALKHDNLYASVGVHPDYEDTIEPSKEWIVENSLHSKVIAVGETGLDYYRMHDRSYASMEWQRNRFRTHIQAAKLIDKPLIIHTRNAGEDTLKILNEEGANKVGGVIHCFTESLDFAKNAIDLGFYISFSGIITFKNAVSIQAVCQALPLDRILIETDSPYLAPVPYRGKTNQPAWVSKIAECIATLRGVSVEDIGYATSRNFHELFKI